MRESRKFIVILVLSAIIGGLLFLNTKRVNAAAVIYDPLEMLNEFVIKPLVRKIANSLENKLVNTTNKLISNINGKQPAFITNWRNNILDSQARGNDIFRTVLADAKLCPYFDKNLKSAFGADKYAGLISGATVKDSLGNVVYQNKLNVPGLPSFQEVSNCTLPSSFNIGAFRNDFTKGGGWAAWNQLIQPQNNFFGVYALALDEQQRQIATEEQSARDSSIAGGGFLSQKLGVGGSGVGPTGCTDKNEIGTLSVPRCVFLGKEITPAKVLGESAANTLDTKLKKIGGATYLTDILLSLFAAIVDGTTSRLANFIAQNTYDKPPESPGVVPGINGFSEQQFAPGVGDPNFDSQANGIKSAGEQSCQSNCKTSCTQKAKNLSCDAAAKGGNGGTSTAGGSGGDSSTNCKDTVDQSTYDSCVSECNATCPPPVSP